MPYKLTAGHFVRSQDQHDVVAHRVVVIGGGEDVWNEDSVLADVLPDETEALALQSAYKLALEAGAEFVRLTTLKKSGKSYVPDPPENPLETRTFTMHAQGSGDPRSVHVTVVGPLHR